MSEARIQALYEQSEALIERGKHAEALDILQEARSLDPASEHTQKRLASLEREMLDAQIDRVLEQAREFLAQGEEEMAFARLIDAEELDATRVDTLELLAEVTQHRNRQLADELLADALSLVQNNAGSDAMLKIEEARRLAPDMPGINDRILEIRRLHLSREAARYEASAQRKLAQGHLMGAASDLRQAQRLNPQNDEIARLLHDVERQLEGDEVDLLLSETRDLMDRHMFASAREKMLEAARIDPQRSEVVRTARQLRKAILTSKADEVKRRLAEAREKAASAGSDPNADKMVIDPSDNSSWGAGYSTANAGYDFGHPGEHNTRRTSNDSTIALMNEGTGQIQFNEGDFEQTGGPDDFGFFEQDDSITLDAEKNRRPEDDDDDGEMIQLPASSLIEDDSIEEAEEADAEDEIIEAEAIAEPADDDDENEMIQLPLGSLILDPDDEDAEALGSNLASLVSDDEDDVDVAEDAADAHDVDDVDDDDDDQAESTADVMMIEDEEPRHNAGKSEMASALAQLSAELSADTARDDAARVAAAGARLREKQRQANRAASLDDNQDAAADLLREAGEDAEDEIEAARLDSSVRDAELSQEDEPEDGPLVEISSDADYLDPSFVADADEPADDVNLRMSLHEGDTSGKLDLGLGDDEDRFEPLDASLHSREDQQTQPDPDAIFAFGEDDDDFKLAGEMEQNNNRKANDDSSFRLADEDDLVLGGEDDPDELSYAEETADIHEEEIIAAEAAEGSSVAMDALDNASLAATAGEDFDPVGFGYYWAVTSEFSVPMGHPLPYGMEDRIDTESLPLRRDVVVFYPSVFGEFPELGLHQLFYKKSGYDAWRTAFQGWMQRHEQKLTSVLKKMFPDGNTHGIHYGVLAKGNWHIALEMTPNQKSRLEGPLANDMDFESDWDEFIRAINDEQWDQAFIREVGFTPPEGCPSFRELRRSDDAEYKAARRDLLTGSWDHFARLYYLKTLLVCRQLCPGIRWGLMGYPATPYLAYVPNNPNIAMFREINDRLKWLWDAEDVILPMFAATRRTVENGVKPDSVKKQNDRKADAANIRTGIEEVVRVRDSYAPDTPIISVHNLEYSKVAGGGPLEQPNFEHQFLLPRDCNVDGIMIAGHIISDPQLDTLAEELSGRLGKAIRDAAGDDDLPDEDDITLSGVQEAIDETAEAEIVEEAQDAGANDDSDYDLKIE